VRRAGRGRQDPCPGTTQHVAAACLILSGSCADTGVNAERSDHAAASFRVTAGWRRQSATRRSGRGGGMSCPRGRGSPAGPAAARQPGRDDGPARARIKPSSGGAGPVSTPAMPCRDTRRLEAPLNPMLRRGAVACCVTAHSPSLAAPGDRVSRWCATQSPIARTGMPVARLTAGRPSHAAAPFPGNPSPRAADGEVRTSPGGVPPADRPVGDRPDPLSAALPVRPG